MLPNKDRVDLGGSNLGTVGFLINTFELLRHVIELFRKYCLGDCCKDAMLIQNKCSLLLVRNSEEPSSCSRTWK